MPDDDWDPDFAWVEPLVALGLAVLLFVGMIIADTLTADAWSVRTANVTGTVVDHKLEPVEIDTEKVGTVRLPSFCATVAYVVHGRQYTVQPECSPEKPVKGTHRQVQYDPRDPSDAVVVGWFERWGLVALFGVAGGVFVAIAGCLAIRLWWRRRMRA